MDNNQEPKNNMEHNSNPVEDVDTNPSNSTTGTHTSLTNTLPNFPLLLSLTRTSN